MTAMDIVGVVLMVGLWLFMSFVVVSFFRTECRESHQPKCRTNLDLFFEDGAATSTRKKLLVAVPLVVLGPITVFFATIVTIIYFARFS